VKQIIQTNTFSEKIQGSFDAFKGLLIILVIMDHNDFWRAIVPDLFKPLTAHVLGFLILPFLVPVRPPSIRFFRDRLIRYLVPFWWVLTMAAVLYYLMFQSGRDVGAVIYDWFMAATVGSAFLVKASSGFYYLWFLPSLAGLVITLTLYQSLNRSWQRVCTVLLLCCHVAITAFPGMLLKYVPFGFMIVLWVFPLGLLMRWAVSDGNIYRARLPILAAFISSYVYLVLIGKNLEIMTLDLRPIADPLLFFLQDLNAISGVLVLMWLATKLNKLRFLNLFGKHSLMVYLLHPLIFLLGFKMLGLSTANLGNGQLLAATALSVGLTALVTLGVALGISRISIARTWLTPKGWADWGPVLLAQNWKSNFQQQGRS
jgi:fucose 4-O-acetylase-like acetyltransferase